jgi:hypothetical protein
MESVNLCPETPKGEKRPADVIGNAVHVMRIATGELEEENSTRTEKRAAAAAPPPGGS